MPTVCFRSVVIHEVQHTVSPVSDSDSSGLREQVRSVNVKSNYTYKWSEPEQEQVRGHNDEESKETSQDKRPDDEKNRFVYRAGAADEIEEIRSQGDCRASNQEAQQNGNK